MPRAWSIARHARESGLARPRPRKGPDERISVGGAAIVIGGASVVLWLILAALIAQILE